MLTLFIYSEKVWQWTINPVKMKNFIKSLRKDEEIKTWSVSLLLEEDQSSI